MSARDQEQSQPIWLLLNKMKKILLIALLGLSLFSSMGNAQWGTQPWGRNPWGRGAFGIGPWGSASTPTVVVAFSLIDDSSNFVKDDSGNQVTAP